MSGQSESARWRQVLLSPRAVGLGDQALWSVGSLIMVLVFARTMPAPEFGQFAMAMSLTLLVQSLHHGLVVLPMSVSPHTQQAFDVRAWARISALVLACGVGVLAAVALAVSVSGRGAGASTSWDALGRAALLALAWVPAYLAYEFVRRCLFVQQAAAVLWRGASTLFVAQMAAVALVVVTGGGALPAVLLLAAAHALAAVVALSSGGHLLRVGPGATGAVFAAHRSAMGWNTAAFLPYAVYNTALPALLGVLGGPAAAGAFAAMRLFLAPLTTLIAAVDSVDKPRAARSLHAGGRPALRARLARTLLWLAVPGAAYLALVGWLGADLVAFLLGEAYVALAPTLPLWLLAGALMLVGQPAETGLLVLGKARWFFWTRAAAALAGGAALLAGVRTDALGAGVQALSAGWAVATLLAVLLLAIALRDRAHG